MIERTLEDFIAALDSADPNRRRNAAWTLGRFRDDRLPARLAVVLRGDADASVRVRASESLGAFRVSEALQALVAAMTGDDDAAVRAQSARSLGRLEATDAADPLINALTDPEPDVRAAAAEALAALALDAAVEPLARALAIDADDSVRYLAAQGLARTGGPRVADTLTALLDQPGIGVATRLHTAEILGQIAEPSGRAVLERLAIDTDETVAVTARWAISRLS
jgi:HEAT repeat protein